MNENNQEQVINEIETEIMDLLENEQEYSFEMSLGELSEIIDGTLVGPEGTEDLSFTEIRGFAGRATEGSVYFCVRNEIERLDWDRQQNLARSAMERGAIALVTSKEISDKRGNVFPTILVDNVYESAVRLAEKKRGDCKKIAIVGSYGKSIIGNLLSVGIGDSLKTRVGESESINVQRIINNLLKSQEDTDVYIQELKGSTKNPICNSSKFFGADSCIIAYVDRTRAGLYDNEEAMLEDIMFIPENLPVTGTVYISEDDENVDVQNLQAKVIGVSKKNKDADVFIERVSQTEHGLNVILVDNMGYDDFEKGSKVEINANIAGEYNAYNVALAYAALRDLGINSQLIVERFEAESDFEAVPGLVHVGKHIIYLDEYKNTNIGLAETLDSFNAIGGSGRRIAILGTSKALLFSDEQIEELSEVLSKEDQIIVYGKYRNRLCRKLWQAGFTNVIPFVQMKTLISYIKTIKPDDKILFKGSKNDCFRFTIDKSFGTWLAVNSPKYVSNWGKKVRGPRFRFKVLNGGNSKLASVYKYRKKEKAVTIGGVISKARVTHVEKNLFKGSNIIAATFRKGIITIGESAFAECNELRVVELKNGIKRIEQEAFRGCSKLETLEIPKSISYIGPMAFADCTLLKTVILPSEGVEINESAFNNCPNLLIQWDNYPEK